MLFFQYWTAAYNILKFTEHVRKQNLSIGEVDIFSYKLDHKIKNEKCINLSAITVILCYSAVVSISYDNSLRDKAGYQTWYSYFVAVYSIVIFGTMAFFFIKATLVMKQASVDFNLGFNYVNFILNFIVILFVVLSAIVWSVGFVISSNYMDEHKIIKSNNT